jgi:L-amino acid N-acyltransferase
MRGVGEVTIRLAEVRDVDAINRIYDHEVRHGTATFDTEPMTREARLAWLAEHASARHPAIVAELGTGDVAGWACLSAWSPRCAYARAAEVSVYVDAGHQGRGIGRALLEELVGRARAAGLGVLLARISLESGAASRALHASIGFATIGVMRRVGEKHGRILDVELMDLHLDGAA